jgi:hypothetical protein
MKTSFVPLSFALAAILSSCSDTPEPVAITGGVAVHGRRFPASLHDNSKWITYAGRNFRMDNVLEAKLGTYGYKRGHALDAQGDLPSDVNIRTAYPLAVTYDSVVALNKAGGNVPKVAEAQASASRGGSGQYKLYVLMADDQTAWKGSIRKAIADGNDDVLTPIAPRRWLLPIR